ncbi:hypothetical protein P13BB106kb_p051 [Pectobacterium phage DU_PP_V]|uniref:Uncharacterized protein n=1 Tax=Pectobacterium phage DU_PP_V TaxID=2041492 RepID=A0A2D2W6W2_9CAUD|nr:hypothetical protein HOS40_gp118 [Pectobacterium phage DU_PP_V]ATS94035.1 hypothetical protein P13BB106kb_p051 [Pectobacterium phage DU_PP_V]
MTKNDAYLYAKRVFRKKYSYIQLEAIMRKEGHSDENISMVKQWLSCWSNGRTI